MFSCCTAIRSDGRNERDRVDPQAVLDVVRSSSVEAQAEEVPRSPAALDRSSSPERSVPRVALPAPLGSHRGPSPRAANMPLAAEDLHKHVQLQGMSDVSTSVGGEPPPNLIDKRSSAQDVVREFVRRAILGVPCELIDLSNGRRRNAVYSVDSALTTFEVQDSCGNEQQSSWPLDSLHDILNAAQHPVVNARRWASLAALGSSDLDRAAMIEALLADGNRVLLMLLEENVLRRDHFVAAMRVLKLYAQSATPQTTARSLDHSPV